MDCATMTPEKLVSWDHLSKICKRVCRGNREWALFKSDREEDYKQPPVPTRYGQIYYRPPHPGYGAMARLCFPRPHVWRGGFRVTL